MNNRLFWNKGLLVLALLVLQSCALPSIYHKLNKINSPELPHTGSPPTRVETDGNITEYVAPANSTIVQVFEAVIGIFSTQKSKSLNRRQLSADFLSKLFEPPVNPLPYNVTGSSANAIDDHFSLLHLESEECKMRVICEVMKEPQAQNGVFGELVASTFGPSGTIDPQTVKVFGKDKTKTYFQAADLGRKLYDCDRLYSTCKKSYKDFLRAATAATSSSSG